jgi:tRNA pseudouridine38-40 synthase
MQKYRCIISYDGTEYAGWQVQSNQRGIANVLQNVFSNVFGHQIKLIGASRTDSGVHALGQVATFISDINSSPETILNAWNNRLPNDIVIRSLSPIEEDFYPRYHVEQKIYWYHIFLERPLPFVQRYGYFYSYPLTIEVLQEAIKIFIGSHDFRSFCTGHDQENTIRAIESISLCYLKRWNVYRLEIKGRGFLRFMIRRIVGACIHAASGKCSLDMLQNVLNEKNPRQTLPNAPAKGLMLYKIVYRETR